MKVILPRWGPGRKSDSLLGIIGVILGLISPGKKFKTPVLLGSMIVLSSLVLGHRLGSGDEMIAVIDYKAGNLTSVLKALRHLGADAGGDGFGFVAYRVGGADSAAGGGAFRGN